MRSMRLRTRIWLGGLAAGGVVAAHLLAFLIVAPDRAQRAELLESSGHGAWPLVASIAMGALVAGLAGFAVGRARDPDGPPGSLYRGIVLRLSALQVAGFLLLEAVERLARNHADGFLSLLGEPVVLIGVAMAAVTAALGAVLLVLVAGLIDRLLVLLRVLPRAPRVLVAAGLADLPAPRPRIALGSVSLRGPPLPIR
jgi:hypothetical protein